MVPGAMQTSRSGRRIFLKWIDFMYLTILFYFSQKVTSAPFPFDPMFMNVYQQRAPGDEQFRFQMWPPLPRKAARFLSPEDFVRASETPVAEPTVEGLMAMQLPYLFEGDIAGIPVDDNNIQFDADSIFRYPQNSALNLVTFPDKLWPKGRIPYTLEEDLSQHERMVIAQAVGEYKEKTCIRFVPKDENDYDYIHVKKNKDLGCSSYVGRAGGNQTVSLEIDKCFSKGIVAHELMHVLGFFHEHSRTDRDKFVKIVDENILPGMLRNFEKYPHKIMDTLDMPYDYGSVMHYHKLAFSRNGKPTIMPFETGADIGQRYRLSDIDAAKVNKLYSCQEFLPSIVPSTPASTTTVAPSTTTSIAYPPTGQVPTARPYTEDKNSTAFPELPPAPTTAVWMVTFPATAATTSTASTAFSSASTTGVPPFKKCEDLNDHCKMWAELGHCKWSEKYMTNYCKLSCNLCENGPEYTPAPSVSIASSNNAGAESTSSKDCADQNLFCGYWSKIGECEREAKFMSIFCKRSCGGCQQQQQFDEPAFYEFGQKRKRRKAI